MITNVAPSKEHGGISLVTVPSAKEESITRETLEIAIRSLEDTMLHLSIFLTDPDTEHLWWHAKLLKDMMVREKSRRDQ